MEFSLFPSRWDPNLNADPDCRPLLFSQWTQILNILERYLESKGYGCNTSQHILTLQSYPEGILMSV